MSGKKSIVIDFDGTILPYCFPNFEPPYPGTKSALEELKRMGFEIIIHTVRTATYWNFIGDDKIPRNEKQLELLKQYFEKYELPYDKFWLSDKPLAKYYIDDRALRLEGGNWDNIINRIKKEEEYV